MRWLTLIPAILAGAAMAAEAPEPVVAAFAVPALLWLPGRGYAARLTRDPLERVVLAFWIAALVSVAGVLLASVTELGGAGVLATAVTATAAGERLVAQPATPLSRPARLGAAAVLITVAAMGAAWWGAVSRPLDAYWWFPAAESAWSDGRTTVPPAPGAGWRTRGPVGWPEARALRLTSRVNDPFLLGPSEGPLVVALRGPVGATLGVDDRSAIVVANPTEQSAEGPVPRYLEHGVTAVALDRRLEAGEKLSVHLSDPEHSVVYVLASADAVWALHAEGELRYTHYYQLLNMVEQVRWARELLQDRRVTDVQPPLPSYILAAPLAVTGGDLPTTNLVFLLELVLVGMAGVAVVAAWSPGAPRAAWLLPAAAVAEHARLMLEPGSAMLPDTLFTLGVLGSVAALAAPRGPRFAIYALYAQLCRYPGSLVAAIAGVLAGAWRRVWTMFAVVFGAAAAFGIAGWLSGSLDGWLATVWWETLPEHWHGEASPSVLLARTPRFYGLWLAYAGGLPLLAALKWSRGTRVLLGTAALYSLLLCTIDHTPSHYFLPLLHLSAAAAASSAAAAPNRLVRSTISIGGLVGLFIAYFWVPVVG